MGTTYTFAWRPQIAVGTDQVGTVQAISAETGSFQPMALNPGTRLWHYDVTALIGAECGSLSRSAAPRSDQTMWRDEPGADRRG